MKIQILNEYHFNSYIPQVRACEVSLGSEGTGMLFAYSQTPNVDPAESMFFMHRSPMEFALFGAHGQMLWHRRLGMGLIPGTWLMPFIAFDMDKDGRDEIWFVNNRSERNPLNARTMILERLDSLTGKTTGEWHFPAENTEWDRLGHAFRFMIFAGYAKEEPVLVTAQGTYGDMFLQAYRPDMSLRWEKKIPVGEGARGSHSSPVFDFNGDGIDEVLWGEHMLSLDTGEELICFDRDRYWGHSDIVLPFIDYHTKKLYLYTGREQGDYDGCPRVVTFDLASGQPVWEDIYSEEWGDYIDDGHIHYGWVAAIRPNYRKIAFAYRKREKKKLAEAHVYNALTGEPIAFPFPYELNHMRPIDLNGDGYHEFLFWQEGETNVFVVDSDGKKVGYTGGKLIHIGKHYNYPGEQFMVSYPEEGIVRIWGDVEAEESEAFLERYHNGFLKNMMKMKGSGYNWLTSIDCAF